MISGERWLAAWLALKVAPPTLGYPADRDEASEVGAPDGGQGARFAGSGYRMSKPNFWRWSTHGLRLRGRTRVQLSFNLAEGAAPAGQLEVLQ
jgi:hypothetical protein